MLTDTLIDRRPVNTHTALTIPAYWRAMDFLAGNLASFGRDVHRNGAEIKDGHALDRLLKRRANPNQTAHTFWRTLFYHGEHHGNGYGYIRRTDPASLTIAGLFNLLPEDTTPFRLIPEDGDEFDATVWYHHKPSRRILPSADVIHYRGLSHDGLLGYSPTQVMAGVFKRATSLESYALKYIDKGTMIKGSIELPAGTTKEQATEIIDTLKQFRAATGDRDILVLSGGATLKNATINATDSQIVQQDRELTKKIAQITGVPPQYLYEQSESKYNNSIEQAGQDVVRFVFRTRIENIEDELTAKLLTDAEQADGFTIKLNADALLRGDTKTQTDTVIATVGGGIRTKNEGRAVLGLPPDTAPESDTLLTPHSVASAPTKGPTDE